MVNKDILAIRNKSSLKTGPMKNNTKRIYIYRIFNKRNFGYNENKPCSGTGELTLYQTTKF